MQRRTFLHDVVRCCKYFLGARHGIADVFLVAWDKVVQVNLLLLVPAALLLCVAGFVWLVTS